MSINLLEKNEIGIPSKLELIPKSQYRKVLRKYLSEDFLKPHINDVIRYSACMLLYIAGTLLILKSDSLLTKAIISLTNGVLLASLTFFLHDLFHGSITRSKTIAHLFGISIGVLNLFSPTFWKRVHNFHHAKTGDISDPDRSYISSEAPKTSLEKAIYKTRISDESLNPIVSMFLMSTGFFWYFFNTMFFGLSKYSNQLQDKKYNKIKDLFKSQNEKNIVFFELFLIFGFQIILYTVICKNNFLNYLFASVVPILIAHFIAMLYIHTNHFLSPLTGEVDDPLLNSLSINNGWFLDKIFSNFSHHVEHHLFPSMPSVHYPKVRKLLQELYPQRFQLISFTKAIKLLFSTPRIYGDSTHLVSTSGKIANCLLPTK